jgi:hypothetical protein
VNSSIIFETLGLLGENLRLRKIIGMYEQSARLKQAEFERLKEGVSLQMGETEVLIRAMQSDIKQFREENRALKESNLEQDK